LTLSYFAPTKRFNEHFVMPMASNLQTTKQITIFILFLAA